MYSGSGMAFAFVSTCCGIYLQNQTIALLGSVLLGIHIGTWIHRNHFK